MFESVLHLRKKMNLKVRRYRECSICLGRIYVSVMIQVCEHGFAPSVHLIGYLYVYQIRKI